jgi:hypothetical protein
MKFITVGVAGCTVLGTDTLPLDVLSKLCVFLMTASHSASYDSVGASHVLCSYWGDTLTTCKKSLKNSIKLFQILLTIFFFNRFLMSVKRILEQM